MIRPMDPKASASNQPGARDPWRPPTTAIVGAGRVGGVLADALADAGWPIRAVVSRDAARRERVAAAVRASMAGSSITGSPADPPNPLAPPPVMSLPDVADLTDDIQLVLLAVPDDAIIDVARRVPAQPGRAIVHTSGVHPASILRPSVPPDALVGSIHPLVAFADPERARAALRGAAMAIDGDPSLIPTLAQLVRTLRARPIELPPGSKAAWHAAAVLSAGGVVALIDVIDELAAVAGLDETTAHDVFGPLMRQAIANTDALGARTALTGPVVRGDDGTIAAHLAIIEDRAPATGEVYRALFRRQASLVGREAPTDPGPPTTPTATTDPEIDPRPAP